MTSELSPDFTSVPQIIFTTLGETVNGLLFVNDGTGHFTEEGGARGTAVTHQLSKSAGTSAVLADYDGDGYLDVSEANGGWKNPKIRP